MTEGSTPGQPTPGIAATPSPPYVAVIFSSTRPAGENGHGVMAATMAGLAAQRPGYLGVESAREGIGITVSYWCDEEPARAWTQVAAHLVAQRRGRDVWYRDYRVRIATVTRDYGLAESELGWPPGDPEHSDTDAGVRLAGSPAMEHSVGRDRRARP